jgi:hypothetical protein
MTDAQALIMTHRRAWQYTYFLLAGLAAIPALLGLFIIPPDPPKWDIDRRIDWIGGALITTGLSLLTFAITQGGLVDGEWSVPCGSPSPPLPQAGRSLMISDVPALFAVSILFILAFWAWEKYLTSRTSCPPLVDLAIFTKHGYKVTSVLLVLFAAYNAIGVSFSISIFEETELLRRANDC